MGWITREEQNIEDCWALEDMYATDALWEEDFKKARKMIEAFGAYAGTAGESAGRLLEILEKQEDMNRLVEKLFVYAAQRHHQDTGNALYQAMNGRAMQLLSRMGDASSFLEPEILALPEEQVRVYMESCPQLKGYERMFSLIFRGKKHVLSPELEALLARTRDMANSPDKIYTNFNNADLDFGTIIGNKDEKVKITHANFVSLQKEKDRRIRKDAFMALYGAYGQYKNTMAAVMEANVTAEAFYAKARNYPSARAMNLFDANIPETVYDKLIDTVHEGLPLMHRYVKARKKILGVEALHMYDVYVPLTGTSERHVSYEEAKQTVLEGLSILGEEYTALLKKGMEERWIDVYENKGKKNGAYSWGCYDSHPYILMNYNGTLSDVFTLAHELGHSLHSWYSKHAQPYIYSGYKIFVAEVASTCNEVLLLQYLLKKESNEEERKYLINYLLEQFKSTLYRQTMFAEFEKLVHEKAAEGEALTADLLCSIYYDLNKIYFGPDMEVDQEIAYEWERIPHFYTPFYVYQYATGFSAALAIAGKILSGEEGILEKYHSFLSGGSSKDPIDLLKICGVDMTSSVPVEAALHIFSEYLEEFEHLI